MLLLAGTPPPFRSEFFQLSPIRRVKIGLRTTFLHQIEYLLRQDGANCVDSIVSVQSLRLKSLDSSPNRDLVTQSNLVLDYHMQRGMESRTRQSFFRLLVELQNKVDSLRLVHAEPVLGIRCVCRIVAVDVLHRFSCTLTYA